MMKHCIHRHGNGRGFTLIELLVVVAIIGLLVSILLPSLRQARRQARLAVCMSNMRQITAAVVMYAADNSDAFPQTMETSSGEPETVSWWAIENYQRALSRYIAQGRGGVEADGVARGKRSVWFDPGDPDIEVEAMWGSFTDNGLLTGVGARLGQVRRPTETVFAALRTSNWSHVVGVEPPAVLPTDNPNDPFWTSEFFDMCLDPWIEGVPAGHPYHWKQGRATPPAALFAHESFAGDWDEQIDGRFPDHPDQPLDETRYGGGRAPYAFIDGHVSMHRFEKTYAYPESNWWDRH